MLMRWKGLFVALGALVLVGAGSLAFAQDSQEPGEAPADQTATPDDEEKKGKLPFALYVYVSAGEFEADPFNTSIATSTTNTSQNSVMLQDVIGARGEIGWKMPNKKGDFRLSFQGYAEDSYKFTASGRAAELPGGSSSATVLQDLEWWAVNIENGELSSIRNPPLWDPMLDDANGNGAVDRAEARYGTPDVTISRPVVNDLQNRAQHLELTYGRAFGGRRYSGRWWGGLRSFQYDGNILAGAWFNTAFAGQGYTDGTNLRLLNLAQETSSLGPTGALEANFNLFDRRVVFYVKGQAAFMVSELKVDSGPFFTLVNTTTGNQGLVVPVPARLTQTRNKSTWQTSGEIGLRVNLKQGVTFDLAWNVTGYLDSLLLVSSIQIPTSLGQAAQGTSAIYNTHDIVLDGARFGVGFQF